MKNDIIYGILIFLLTSIVFGYGHHLTDSSFLKWLCVATWAGFTATLIEAFARARSSILKEKDEN